MFFQNNTVRTIRNFVLEDVIFSNVVSCSWTGILGAKIVNFTLESCLRRFDKIITIACPYLETSAEMASDSCYQLTAVKMILRIG